MNLPRLALALSLTIAGTPCLAQYAFVDESGVWRTIAEPMDDRYVVFRKLPPPPIETPVPEIATEVPDLPGERPTMAALRKQYADVIGKTAREERIDAALLHAVVTVESGYNVRAKSPKGASGLMQLMPATAQRYGVADIWDPQDNVRGGARYLRDLLALFDHNLQLVLAAYNAGEGAVLNFGSKIPPYAETRSYVPRVLELYERYRGGR